MPGRRCSRSIEALEAQLAAARGELSAQRARLAVAQATLARVKPLVEQNALSKKGSG